MDSLSLGKILQTFGEPYRSVAVSAAHALANIDYVSSGEDRPVPARRLAEIYALRAEILAETEAIAESGLDDQRRQHAMEIAHTLAHAANGNSRESWYIYVIEYLDDEFWIFANEEHQGRFIARWPSVRP